MRKVHLQVALFLGIALATADSAALAQTGGKLDPTLVPGLKAELKAAQDEAASARESADAATKEMDVRRAEMDRWLGEIASVDKDKAIYETDLKVYTRDWENWMQFRDEHNARCAGSPEDAGLIASCNAEVAPGNKEQDNLNARRTHLYQTEANLNIRYDEIRKLVQQLQQRQITRASDYMNAISRYNQAAARVQILSLQLQQQ